MVPDLPTQNLTSPFREKPHKTPEELPKVPSFTAPRRQMSG